MSLTNSLRRAVAQKTVTTAAFSTQSAGEEYLRNGYYGIYNAAYSGTQINDNRALSLSAFYAGVKIISEDVGSCTLLTLEQKGQTQVEATGHSLYSRLRYAPNPDMTAMQFREALTAHAIMCGHGYARKDFARGDSERIIAMWPMMPYEVRRDQDQRGRPVFIHTEGNSPSRTLESRQVFQLNGFGLTGRDGLNLLQYARSTLGLSLAQEEYAGRFFSQDQTPNLVLIHPGKTDVDGVKRAWAGVGADGKPRPEQNWHAPKVIGEGMKVEQLHPDAQKSQLIEQRVFQLLEICRLLRMPPHKLAELGRATWGNIGDENQSYYTGTLRPWFRRWEEALKLHCYGVDTPYFAEHDASDLLRGDFTAQSVGNARLLEKGVLSINEVRTIFNYNPIEGGDEHFIQLNMGTLEQVAQAATEPPAAPPQGPKLVPVGGKR